MRNAGQETDPLVIPVPGNHDLVHLDDFEVASLYNLDSFWKDPEHPFLQSLCKKLWEARNAAYFHPLFGNYAHWFSESILPRFADRQGVVVRPSHFPGDFSVFLDLPDRPPVTVVGLNSAWVQYNKGDFERRIELFTQRLHYALSDGAAGSPLDELAGRLNLLLMYHPAAWLSAKATVSCSACTGTCTRGAPRRYPSRAASSVTSFRRRPCSGWSTTAARARPAPYGYASGEMDAAGTVGVWPLKRGPQGGRQVFLWETEFEHDPAGHRPLRRAGDPRLDGDSFIEVPGTGRVSLGKYPVTVQEYQAFVDAGGYREPKYWEEEGWRLRSEQGWSEPNQWDQQLDHPNWPVTGVSWYEARAFCRWRSSDGDWTIRLPTEAEWQTAATPDGRRTDERRRRTDERIRGGPGTGSRAGKLRRRRGFGIARRRLSGR